MSSGVMFIGETPESAATRAAVESLVFLAPQSCRKALRSIIGRQERDTIGAFRKMATPGGPPWEPNPEDYAEFKRNVLGQSRDQIGVLNGRLRQSISADINEAALEGRVGSSDPNAQSFSEGGPIDPLVFIYGKGRWLGFWFGYGQTAPGRRFLPTVDKATKDAHETVERVLRQTIQSTGLRLAGAGGLGLEEFL